jgi:hypothetical protein
VFVDWIVRRSSGKPAFRLSSTLHLFFDTCLGLVVGYHFVGGLNVYFQYVGGPDGFELWLLVASLLTVFGVARLFYWSTERWLKRMGHDEAGVERPLTIGLSHDR